MSDLLAIDLINQALKDLFWDWSNSRLQDWLKRVASGAGHLVYLQPEDLPEKTAISLASFLDLFYKCDKILTLELGSNWNHELCKQVAKEYGGTNGDKMPLAGYKRLLEELEAAATWEDIPF